MASTFDHRLQRPFTLSFLQGTLQPTSGKTALWRVMVHDSIAYERRVVAQLRGFDYEEAVDVIENWASSEKGQWVVKHGLHITVHAMKDHATQDYLLTLTAHIEPKRWTEYCLRFS